ncbi:MAG: CoA transferase [Acidobacteria bacterium]|nr:CoA transferase [Acidobacteriota bacterium]
MERGFGLKTSGRAKELSNAAFTGRRVLDLTTPLGHLCGKILADLGADVIKIEPPAGDAGRFRSPFYSDNTGASHSLFWLAYNNNKRGITLNLESGDGRALLARLAQQADFLLESFPPGCMDSLGIGYEKLAAANPELVYTAITPFGQTGPYRDFQGDDLEIMALSGVMSLTGHPGRTPLRISLAQSEAWASLYGAMGALTALRHRQESGRGQFVDVSAQAACVILCAHAPWFWDYNREIPSREGEFMTGRTITGAKFRTVWPCRDGYLTFIIYGGPAGQKTNRALTEWMDSHGCAPEFMKQKDWDRFDVATITQPEVDRTEEAIGKFFVNLTKQEFIKGGLERGMLGYPISTAADILADGQLTSRNFWQMVQLPGCAEPVRFPGPFAKFSNMDCGEIRLAAPALGEHNSAVYGGELGVSERELQRMRAARII